MSASLRTFVALTIDTEARAHLAEVGSQIARMLDPGSTGRLRLVRPERLHVTVAFLGDTRREVVADVCTRMAEVASRSVARAVLVDRILLLPKPTQVRVVASGFRDDGGMVGRLSADLASSLQPLGFQMESRAFLPHITLARCRASLRVQPASVPDPLTHGKFMLRLRKLVHFASFLEPRGARYEVLSTVSLPEPIS